MPGLNTSLLTAMHALMAQQGGMDVTSSNIANANTPGYSRQVPVFEEAEPSVEGNLTYGNGVQLVKFQSVRDQLLDLRIQEETSLSSSADAQTNATQQIQPLFTTTGQDVGSQISAFFTSMSQLSADPANLSLRTGMITAAQNLATSFHNTVSNLVQIQTGLDGSVPQAVGQINQLTQQIAGLNNQLVSLQAGGQDGGTVKDEQTELIRQLSQITGISVIQTESGISITTGDGTALVVGNQAFSLQSSVGSDGFQHVMAQGQDITSSLASGSLGGTLAVRNQAIPGTLGQLDTLASDFTTAFNTVHAQGTDLNGNPGGDFFAPLSTVAGAAAQFNVAITDPAAIAASSDGSAGSNGNLTQLQALESSALPSGQTPTDAYSTIVFNVGTLASNAQAESDASATSLQQLTDQRSALSGVSINEESTNLILYQQAFEAAARVITTIDQLNEVVLNMGATSTGY
ncbi:MAG TPA: flagellar hook-associated protein FlgK [Candidatus Angelobacter sp.]|nr:flagellar hook-associated protein FlgK [Candidatus Angelobacter sp.]